jgi:hypothetical protein
LGGADPLDEDVIADDVRATLGLGAGPAPEQPEPAEETAPQPAAPQGPAPIDTTRPLDPGAVVDPLDPNSLSDSQDFQTHIKRESIESDAEKLARMREQRQEVTPDQIIEEPAATTGPNPTEFALSTTHQVGEKVYRRSGLKSASKAAAECAKYASVDAAQRAFLAAGGPKRDRKGMDPDGDGFVCGWSPTGYRQAAGNG